MVIQRIRRDPELADEVLEFLKTADREAMRENLFVFLRTFCPPERIPTSLFGNLVIFLLHILEDLMLESKKERADLAELTGKIMYTYAAYTDAVKAGM